MVPDHKMKITAYRQADKVMHDFNLHYINGYYLSDIFFMLASTCKLIHISIYLYIFIDKLPEDSTYKYVWILQIMDDLVFSV